jgi:hypothetical protein
MRWSVFWVIGDQKQSFQSPIETLEHIKVRLLFAGGQEPPQIA